MFIDFLNETLFRHGIYFACCWHIEKQHIKMKRQKNFFFHRKWTLSLPALRRLNKLSINPESWCAMSRTIIRASQIITFSSHTVHQSLLLISPRFLAALHSCSCCFCITFVLLYEKQSINHETVCHCRWTFNYRILFDVVTTARSRAFPNQRHFWNVAFNFTLNNFSFFSFFKFSGRTRQHRLCITTFLFLRVFISKVEPPLRFFQQFSLRCDERKVGWRGNSCRSRNCCLSSSSYRCRRFPVYRKLCKRFRRLIRFNLFILASWKMEIVGECSGRSLCFPFVQENWCFVEVVLS